MINDCRAQKIFWRMFEGIGEDEIGEVVVFLQFFLSFTITKTHCALRAHYLEDKYKYKHEHFGVLQLIERDNRCPIFPLLFNRITY